MLSTQSCSTAYIRYDTDIRWPYSCDSDSALEMAKVSQAAFKTSVRHLP